MTEDDFDKIKDVLSATFVGLDRKLVALQTGTLNRRKKIFEDEIKKDERFTLPAGMIRPYQLWFGFLKAALADPDLRVDRDFYRPWGAVEGMTFAQWWPEHWRKLFAIDQSIRVAESLEDVDLRDGVVWVRLPLNKTRGALVTRVGRIVEECQSERKEVYEQGLFGFDCGVNEAGRKISPATRFLKDIDDVDVLLWLYAASLIGKKEGVTRRGEGQAAFLLSLVQYASDRGRSIKAPSAITSFLDEMVARGARRHGQRDPNLPEHRRQLARYLKKAKQVAQNVAQGKFPGRYQEPDMTET